MMKKIIALLFAPLAGCMAEPPMEMSAQAQTELAAVTEGRVAEQPRTCVPRRDVRGNRSVGDAIVFDGTSRNMVYVNRASGGCAELRSGRTLVTRSPSSQLCAGDIADVVEPVSGFPVGSCTLGEFIPYRRLR